MLNLNASKEDRLKIASIAKRAHDILGLSAVDTVVETIMDITAANNTCPLDLDALLEADRFDFAHDVFGIRQHLNRETGVMGGSFLPRFALNQAA